MEKPLLLIRKDFINKITNIMNDSHLPLIIIEPILSGLLDSIRNTIQIQEKKEEEKWNEYLRQSEKEPN